ncbi:MAG: hypothetical protein KIT36_19520 [Alphaproteobacteria bacterium]|nr:hypothetical protein [Alphaproteobacteria bacterium]
MPLISSLPQDVVWSVFAAVLLLAGVIIGFALGWPARSRERAALADRDAARADALELSRRSEEVQSEVATAKAAAARVPGLEAELAALRKQLHAATSGAGTIDDAQLRAEETRAAMAAALATLRDDVEAKVATVVDAAVRRNQTDFAEVVQRMLENHKQTTEADLQTRQGAIVEVVKPVTETLEKCEQRLAVLEQESAKAVTSLASRANRRDRTRAPQRSATSRRQKGDTQDDAPTAANGAPNGSDNGAGPDVDEALRPTG